MSPIESLIAQYDEVLNFYFEEMPIKLHGLIVDNNVYINKLSTAQQQYAAIAEELGHYETSVNEDITDYKQAFNLKQENKARFWSYKKIVPVEQLKDYILTNDSITVYDLAAHFDTTVGLMEQIIEVYKIKQLI